MQKESLPFFFSPSRTRQHKGFKGFRAEGEGGGGGGGGPLSCAGVQATATVLVTCTASHRLVVSGVFLGFQDMSDDSIGMGWGAGGGEGGWGGGGG